MERGEDEGERMRGASARRVQNARRAALRATGGRAGRSAGRHVI